MLTSEERENRLRGLPDMGDLDLANQLDEYIGFIKEFLDNFSPDNDIGWIGVEANNRMDMVQPMLNELWERLKRKTATMEKEEL